MLSETNGDSMEYIGLIIAFTFLSIFLVFHIWRMK
jgi:hypothetical protein